MLSSRDADRFLSKVRFEPRYTRYVAGKGARRWRSNRIELAAEFGVSTTTISNITKGNTYAA